MPPLTRWLACLLLGAAALNSSAVQINRTSSTNLYVDFSSDMRCSYVSYMVTNTDKVNYSNLWVTIDSFTNTTVRLGGGDLGQYALGALATNQAKPVFFYLQATNQPATNQHTIKVFNGYPTTGTLLNSSNFVLTVVTSGQNQANKVNSVTYSPTNSPVLGGLVKISVQGTTGNVAAGNDMSFSAATFTNWLAGAWELVACNIVITDSPNVVLTNVLDTASTIHITGTGDPYQADYWVRAVAVTTSNTPVSPVSFVNNGGGSINHVQESSLLTLPPVIPSTNMTVLNSAVSYAQLYTNETLTLSLQFSNASSVDVTIDRVVDTLPAGFLYVSNSTTFNGGPLLDPTPNGQVFSWAQPCLVPANSSRSFTFQAIPTLGGYATNAAVAFIKTSQIDTTLNTADNAPALQTIRALLEPTAVNDTATTLEDKALTVPAPGVLANDAEPNTFNLAVVSYTPPAHGTVSLNTNGAYTYTPNPDYYGADSFTYTVTNGNARVSTASVSLTVTAVNDPPSFTKGIDQTLLEDAGAQTLVNWATNLSPGPANEAAQTLTFLVSNDNNALFSAQPAIASNGTLTFTPAPNANGSATVTVYLQDNGGSANGGSDTSAPQTFTITVTAVNDAPFFTKGADQTVLEDAGAQTVATWATAISAGAPNETNQALLFHASNSNPSLFSTQPAITANGTLTFTPAANANGSATVTVTLQDNGGTANGGSDTSAPQTFTISVTAVNDPPTLNPISPVTLNEDASQQTVTLSGITAGPADEAGQQITVSAFSSNPGLIPNPTVTYASPQTTGTLRFTPTATSNGVATIAVVVSDNGGTANGGVNTLTNTFTVTVSPLTTIWATNGGLAVQVNDATGAPGVGYDTLHLTGDLQIQATSTNPFTIQLVSLLGSAPGPATNFDKDTACTWTIATTTRGISGFSPDKFLFDTAQFTNDLAGGRFSVGLSDDGLSVNVLFTPNQAPVANPINYSRAHGTFLRVPLQEILTNYTSDPDGDATRWVSLGASTNGSWVGTNSAYLVYAPTNNISESFFYIISDARSYRPGDTVRLATNWFNVTVTNALGFVRSLVPQGTNVSVRFAGIPGYSYDVERTTNIATGPWNVLWTTTAPPAGVWFYLDNSPPAGGAYYRTKQH